jgi:hypothetical protein
VLGQADNVIHQFRHPNLLVLIVYALARLHGSVVWRDEWPDSSRPR